MPKSVKWLLIALCVIGGMYFVGKLIYNENFVAINRDKIEQNVRHYIRLHKLDPDKVVIENIGEPQRYPTGEREFTVYIRYTGDPYFFLPLTGNPETLQMSDPKEQIIVRIFNELYLEERYDEYRPAIEYLHGLEIIDPLRPEGSRIKFFQTSIGVNPEINSDLRKAFWEDETLDGLKQYIKDNREKISELDKNTEIIGRKEGINEQQANEIRVQLERILPRKSNYYVQIGVKDYETGIGTGLYDYLELSEAD